MSRRDDSSGFPVEKGYRRHEDAAPELVVKAAVKRELDDVNVSSDFYDALNVVVANVLHEAEERARENDRKTVQPRDL
jgi:histone H3/H4